MAHVTPTLASVFLLEGASASWSKLRGDHGFSQLYSKYWGKDIEHDAKQWRKSHSSVMVDPIVEMGPECFGLDLGVNVKESKMWVRQDYIRIYDYCSRRHQEGPSSVTARARSVVITGQPGVGVFLFSVAACAPSNNPSCEKVKHIGRRTRSVVVSANRSHFFGTEAASVSYLSKMECLNKTSIVSPLMTLRHFYGRSSMRTDIYLVFTKNSFVTQTSILYSPPLRSETDGSL
jgi:hypothetical protein